MNDYRNLIIACRRRQRDRQLISDGMSRSIAQLWQSPSVYSRGITALAHGLPRLASLRSEVERELREIQRPRGTAVDRLLLSSLLKWITANPIEFVRYEQVIFMQGDDADEALKIIYPDSDGVSTGQPDAQAGLDHLRRWDYGDDTGSEIEDDPCCFRGTDSSYSDDDYLMIYNFGYTCVGLWRKIKEIG